jgi:hypothetical protein
MNQKLKSILCALMLTAFASGAIAATAGSSFAASEGPMARKTVVSKKHRRHRRVKKNGVVAQNRSEGRKATSHRKSRKSSKKAGANPMPIIPGADDANA